MNKINSRKMRKKDHICPHCGCYTNRLTAEYAFRDKPEHAPMKKKELFVEIQHLYNSGNYQIHTVIDCSKNRQLKKLIPKGETRKFTLKEDK